MPKIKTEDVQKKATEYGISATGKTDVELRSAVADRHETETKDFVTAHEIRTGSDAMDWSKEELDDHHARVKAQHKGRPKLKPKKKTWTSKETKAETARKKAAKKRKRKKR